MKFAFYSCMSGVNWGGSEELWWHVATRLRQEGHDVSVNFKWWPRMADKLVQLEQSGARLFLRERPPRRAWMSPVLSAFRQVVPNNGSNQSWLERERPNFLLVTLGYHPDRVALASECMRLKIPYAIQLQCASWNIFVPERSLDEYREAYSNAERVFVVSQENLDKLEINLGMKLPNAELICNSFGLPWECQPSWPTSDRLKLACVGRIHFASKGQDLLVQVLKRPHWRDRNIEVVLFGKDQGNQRHLESLIELNGLQDKIKFGGFCEDLESLWKEHHGLVLCSRYEGAAIVVVEAMMAHRLVISTDTGRNRELIDDSKAGFIAPAPTADLLDEAMSRAWEARARWREMGLQAGQDIRARFPRDPAGDFLNRLKEIAHCDSQPEGSPKPVQHMVNA